MAMERKKAGTFGTGGSPEAEEELRQASGGGVDVGMALLVVDEGCSGVMAAVG